VNIKDKNLLKDLVVTEINYKDKKVLSNFLSDQGKILPRRNTGLTSKEQKIITKLIKRARIAAILPFVIGKC
jgi:small subunit ribosomal protein S18|tara:strand:+ start:46376 stop:46591 length:216 start_codon:yes stop_codon:yes gene_type:complete